MTGHHTNDGFPDALPATARPDYAGSGFLNLIASLEAGLGGTPRHPTLRELAAEEIARSRHVVFLIVDGLGHDRVAARPDSAFAAHLRAPIRAVFPSTTAAAITTAFTGRSPAEHGMTGWHLHLPEAGGVVESLPMRLRAAHTPLAELGIGPDALFAAAPLAARIASRTLVVLPAAIADSTYSRHCAGPAQRIGYADGDAAALAATVADALAAASRRTLVHAYYSELDAASHRHGAASPAARSRLDAIDAAFAALLVRLRGTGTLLVATADHGFVDRAAHEALDVADAPGLASLLRLPLCGEPRVAWCHVRAGCEERFAAAARAWLGPRGWAVPSRRLLDLGWLGPGEAHPRLAERIGDVALIMRGSHVVHDRLPGERGHAMIGNHGGASAAEMEVPLIVARA